MKAKILSVLDEAAPALLSLKDDFFMIGASAMILSGVDIKETHDIDILTSFSDSQKLRQDWKDKIEINPTLKESHLFRSNFTRYNFNALDIEVMGELEVYKNENWSPLLIQEFEEYQTKHLSIKIPTLREQVRILQLFGREKDLKRIDMIRKYISTI